MATKKHELNYNICVNQYTDSNFITINDFETVDGNRQAVSIYDEDLPKFIDILQKIQASKNNDK